MTMPGDDQTDADGTPAAKPRGGARDAGPPPDVTHAVHQADEDIRKLEAAAASFRDRDEGYIQLIGLYTLIAAIVAGVNLFFEKNLAWLGGWVPFCLATTVLTGLASFYAGKLKRERPEAQKEQCLKLLHRAREVRRKLTSPKLTDSGHAKLRQELGVLESDAAGHLLPRGPNRVLLWGCGVLGVILLGYFGWIGWAYYQHKADAAGVPPGSAAS